MVDIKQEGDLSIIDFKGTHNSIVNSIRRIILDEVPTFAIEDVEVVLNGSPLYDETIAHRLGLVPLKTDLKSYNFKDKCTCGGIGCALCEVKLALKKDGEGYVYSGSIKSDDPQIVPAEDKIPITKLFGENGIELNLKAILGKGREHAKWAPAHTYLRDNDKGVELVIESFGQLSSKDIYNKAIDILIEKIENLEGEL
ncbi:MAG: DNA-directed RNA polymerase subunit D [Nanoarchaeota archaeon]|nr:DNA-directed RNA polymerase subunit D [Nanoarchaeota archaeon]